MKYCPNCQTTYTDETLKFCLQDGTPLVESVDSPMDTVSFGNEETVITTRQVERVERIEPIHVPVQQSPPPQQQYQQQQIPPPQIVQPPIRQQTELPPVIETHREVSKPRTGSTVALTILGTLLLLGLLGGAWMFMRNRDTEVAVNVNTGALPPAVNRPVNVNSAANQALNQPSNQTLNANIGSIPPTATATPVAKPTLNSEQANVVTEDVQNTVDDWRSSTEDLDIDAHLSQYANTVDYYRAGRVGLAQVRADKQRAYNQYDSVELNISNMKVTPDETGNRATALFDKEWNFAGDRKNSSGKVQQQLTLSKIGGRWLITGEKDVKVYYINN
jgi:hypothetical protein